MAEIRYVVKDPLFKKDDGFKTLNEARRYAMRLMGFYTKSYIIVTDLKTGESCGTVTRRYYGTLSRTGAYTRYDVFVWEPRKRKLYSGSMDPNVKILNRDGSVREQFYKIGSGRVYY